MSKITLSINDDFVLYERNGEVIKLTDPWGVMWVKHNCEDSSVSIDVPQEEWDKFKDTIRNMNGD